MQVLVVSGNRELRRRLKAQLLEADVDRVVELRYGAQALQQAHRYWPDVVVVGYDLRGTLDGVETTHLLKLRHEVPNVVGFAGSGDDVPFRFLAAGANAYFGEGEIRQLVAHVATQPSPHRTWLG